MTRKVWTTGETCDNADLQAIVDDCFLHNMIAVHPYSFVSTPIGTSIQTSLGALPNSTLARIFSMRINPLTGDHIWVRYTYTCPDTTTNDNPTITHRFLYWDRSAVISDQAYVKTKTGSLTTVWDSFSLKTAGPGSSDISALNILYEMHAHWGSGSETGKRIQIYTPEIMQDDGSYGSYPDDMLWPK